MPNSKIIPKSNLQYIYDIVFNLEAISLIFFASSSRYLLSVARIIISNLVEVVDTVLSELAFNVEVYQSLITETRNIPHLTTGHICIKNALRVLPFASPGVEIAYEILFQYVQVIISNLDPNIDVPKTDKVLSLTKTQLEEAFIGVSSVLYSLASENKARLYILSQKLLGCQDDLGIYAVAVIPSSLHIHHLMHFITFLKTMMASMENDQGMIEQTPKALTTIKNCMKAFIEIVKQNFWEQQMISLRIFSEITLEFVAFCDLVPGQEFRLLCSKCLIALNKLLNNYNLSLLATDRNTISKTLIGWLNVNATKSLSSLVIIALASMIDNLNFFECVDTSLPKTPKEQASSLFMFYFVAIKSQLDSIDDDSFIEIVPVLAGLLKQNLEIGMEHCLSMGFTEKDRVRTVFMSALASVFKVPEAKVVDAGKFQKQTLIDILFEGDLELIEYLSGIISYSRAEIFGNALMNAAIYLKCEHKLLEKMIQIELKSIDESTKTTLFRGNSVPSRVVGQYPRLVGTKWMINLLRPIFTNVINKCKENKTQFIIEHNKIGPNDNIEENRQNFRDLINDTIDKIYHASLEMPDGIKKEMQLIYQNVHEKYGDFAYQILNGFFFLRFLLPTFTLPKLIGLPEVLPDSPRLTLLQMSSFLMTTTLKRNLDDKGPDYYVFNDIVDRGHTLFYQMFKEIIENKIDAPYPPLLINEITTQKTLHAEIWPIQQQLLNIVMKNSEETTLCNSIENLVNKLQSMGQPKAPVRPRCATISNVREDVSSKLGNLLNLKFSEEQLQQINGFIVHEGHTAIDGSAIIYLFTNKLGMITDPTIVSYIIMKTLNDEPNSKVTFVVFLDSFDETKLPTSQMIKKLIAMKPAIKISRYLFFEPNYAFSNFVSRNQSLFDKTARFIFVKDLNDFNAYLGPPSEIIPESTLESLTKPDSVHAAIVNGKKTQVQLHQRSIQLVGEIDKYKTFEFAPISVIMARNIDKYTRPHPCNLKPNYEEFIIGTNTKQLYTFIQPINSTLYEAIFLVAQRSQTFDNLKGKIKIDSSTLQWFMLILTFVNLVDEHSSSVLKKASIDLAYAVYSSFTFKRKLKIIKTTPESLSEDLFGYVKRIAEDLAENNPESYYEFINEYLNTYKYLEERVKTNSLIFLKPWLKYYVNDIEAHPEIIEKIIEIYKSLPKITSFINNIWIDFLSNKKALELLMRYIFKKCDNGLIQIVLYLASFNKENVSDIWVNTLMKECYDTNNESIIFVGEVISTLLISHLFDMKSSMTNLVYYTVNLRFKLPKIILLNLLDMFFNMLHMLILTNNRFYYMEYSDICSAFYTDGENLRKLLESYHRKSNNYKFIQQSHVLENALHNIISLDSVLATELFHKFFYDMDNTDDIIQVLSSLLQAAAFSKLNTNDFIKKSIYVIKKTNDKVIISYACESFIMIMNEVSLEQASKLFYFGIISTFYIKKSIAINLSLIAYSKFKDYNKLSMYMDKNVIEKIQNCLSISLDKEPILILLILFSMFYHTDDIEKYLKNILPDQNMNLLEKVISLMYKNELDDDISFDFGELSGTVATVLVLIVKSIPKSALLEYLIKWIKKDPSAFRCFNILKIKYGAKILSCTYNPYFASLLILAQESDECNYVLDPLMEKFIKGKDIDIDLNQFLSIMNQIFP